MKCMNCMNSMNCLRNQNCKNENSSSKKFWNNWLINYIPEKIMSLLKTNSTEYYSKSKKSETKKNQKRK